MKFILAASGNAPDDWPLLHKAALEAEELGFWAFLLPDHFMGGRDFGGDSTLDTWLALSYLAPLTDNIRLGSLVTPVTLRPPSILAKMVSTLDVLSDGRTVLGIGAGSSQSEFEGYGQWDSSRVRVRITGNRVSSPRHLPSAAQTWATSLPQDGHTGILAGIVAFGKIRFGTDRSYDGSSRILLCFRS